MKKVIVFMVMMVVAGTTMEVAARRGVPTLERWAKAENVGWESLDFRYSGVKSEDWRDKFPALTENVDIDMADQIWKRVTQAKAAFHQENLWMLTSGNDSLVAAMIDVEWAFDGIFLMYMMPKLGGGGMGSPRAGIGIGHSVSGAGIDEMKFAQIYDKSVAEKVKVIEEMGGVRYDKEVESVIFADSIKRWSVYGTVKWSDEESGVEQCPERYFKKMGKGHKQTDVRSEWIRVQNAIAQFRGATQWMRDRGDKKIDKALDECEESMMKYFEKYVKGAYMVDGNKEVYSEVMPMAIDVLCMEYVSAGKKTDK